MPCFSSYGFALAILILFSSAIPAGISTRKAPSRARSMSPARRRHGLSSRNQRAQASRPKRQCITISSDGTEHELEARRDDEEVS